MNRKESNRMRMFQGTNAVLAQYQDTIDTLPALAETVGEYRAALNAVLEHNNEYLGVAAGATASKDSAVEDAIELVIPIVNVLRALANRTGNEELKAVARLPISRLRRNRMEERVRRIGTILEAAQARSADIAPYGITGEKLDALQQSFEALRDRSDMQLRKIAGSRANREQLYDAIILTNDILRKELDPVMEVVKTVNTDFFHAYKAARVVIDLHGSGSKSGEMEVIAAVPAAVTAPAPVAAAA